MEKSSHPSSSLPLTGEAHEDGRSRDISPPTCSMSLRTVMSTHVKVLDSEVVKQVVEVRRTDQWERFAGTASLPRPRSLKAFFDQSVPSRRSRCGASPSGPHCADGFRRRDHDEGLVKHVTMSPRPHLVLRRPPGPARPSRPRLPSKERDTRIGSAASGRRAPPRIPCSVPGRMSGPRSGGPIASRACPDDGCSPFLTPWGRDEGVVVRLIDADAAVRTGT